MAADANNQQVVFLPEGSKRTRGRDAQRINILIGKAVAQAVKSTLGPKGMDKMIVDELGDVTVSNDGATILKEMSIEHPIGKMMVDVAKTQESEVGDGTTTSVIIAGGLLGKAENMLDEEIHPSIIIKGYRLASRKAVEIAKSISEKISFNDKDILKKIAITSMTGKSSEAATDLSSLVVEAVKIVAEHNDGKIKVDKDSIKVEKKAGSSLEESKLIKGLLIDKEIVHGGMPKEIKNAKIALIDSALEIKETETDAKIQITSPEQLQAFLDQEEAMLKKMVDKVKSAGATVVFCQKGIDDLAQHFMAKAGIAGVRRVKKSDMDKLSKATGAKIVTKIDALTAEDLGGAGKVREEKVGEDEMVYVEDCPNPKAVTILVRGSSEHLMAEAERAIDDAIGSVSSAIRDGQVVTGGGAFEVEIAMQLREFAKTVGGKEQLAIHAFADVLEIVPKTLAETAGMNPLDTLVNLRAKHSEGGKNIGLNVFSAELEDMRKQNVIEPLSVKTRAIISGSEVAEMILRIDDIVAGQSRPMPSMPPGGMPPMDM
ncbi:MAG TPA: thermosome subunit beta [archaeon]|nr:thermosome subunit beta [archaeon]